jgi:hypothetical protein
MKTLALLLAPVLILVGCTTTTATTTVVNAQPVATAPAKYTGMVWTWDAERNIVTLNDAGRQFRVLVTPEQIRTLRLHENATVTGQLLGPDLLETVLLPTAPMAAMPNGPASRAEITGQISGIEANDVAAVDSARGPLRVWLADGGATRFATGRPVKVDVSVQPVRMVPIAGSGGQASGPTIEPTSPPVPGDQAVVVGRILSITPTGTMTVDSPRGPVTVWVPDAANFRMGDFVQVRTVVSPS